jgi:hypothetical protein
MADINKTVSIGLQVKTAQLEKALGKIPDITNKEMKAMVATLDKNLAKAEKRGAKASKRIGAGMKQMGKAAGMAGAAISAAAVAVVGYGQKMADLTNQLVDASVKTGIQTETLAGLRLAAEGSGRSFEDLEGGLIRFQQSMLRATQTTGPQRKAFDMLGVSVADVDGNLRDADSIFRETLASLSAMEAGTKRNAALMDLFGRSAGPALIQSGALDNLDAMVDMATQFGVDVGPKAVSEAANFQRNMAALGTVSQGVLQNMIDSFGGQLGLARYINEATEAIVYFGEIAESVGGLIAQSYQNFFGKIHAAYFFLTGETERAGELLNEIAKDNVEAVDGVLSMFAKADRAVSDYRQAVAKTQPTLKHFAEDTGRAAATAKEMADAAKAMAEAQKINAALNALIASTYDDLGDRQEKIEQGYWAQVEALDALAASGADAERIQLGMALAEARAMREMSELRAIEAEELDALREKRDADNEEKLADQAAIKAGHQENMQFAAESTTMFLSGMSEAIGETLENTGQMSAVAARRLHRLNQSAGVADIVTNAAVAVMKGFAQLGPVGGGINAVAMGALSAAQIAAVVSQPVPEFDTGGMVGSRGFGGPDQVGASLLTGEAVLDRQTVRNMGGADGVRSLQRGGGGDTIVVNSFKHFDRFLASSMRRPSRIRGLVTSPKGAMGY